MEVGFGGVMGEATGGVLGHGHGADVVDVQRGGVDVEQFSGVVVIAGRQEVCFGPGRALLLNGVGKLLDAFLFASLIPRGDVCLREDEDLLVFGVVQLLGFIRVWE